MGIRALATSITASQFVFRSGSAVDLDALTLDGNGVAVNNPGNSSGSLQSFSAPAPLDYASSLATLLCGMASLLGLRRFRRPRD